MMRSGFGFPPSDQTKSVHYSDGMRRPVSSRDAIRSQCSTCSRHKEKETGYEKDEHCSGKWKHDFQRTQAHDWSGPRRSLVVLLRFGGSGRSPSGTESGDNTGSDETDI